MIIISFVYFFIYNIMAQELKSTLVEKFVEGAKSLSSRTMIREVYGKGRKTDELMYKDKTRRKKSANTQAEGKGDHNTPSLSVKYLVLNKNI